MEDLSIKVKRGNQMEECNLKWGIDKTINMGRALGIGFCYTNQEVYLYINIWKYNIAIGKFYH